MSNVEIYDSSNSQLSSDEYSHDEDDDALMDVAVSKQTPAKSAKSKSNDSSPNKTDSTSTTPRKLSDDLDAAAAAASTKPPASREHTQRQIKQMQRDNQANLYFKRRSIKWLNQRVTNKTDYMSQLRRALPKIQAQARRMAEYRAAKRAIEREQQARHQQRRHSGRTPSRSRSRSHTGSLSPELICLDDTENEDSPEKPTDTPAAGNEPQQVASKTPPPFTLQLEIESEATPAENGSVLDEFLTLKPVIAAEPIIEEAAGCNNSIQQQQQQQDMPELPALDLGYKAAIETRASLDMPLEEATLKRRRSVTPPSTEPHVEKRTKSLPAVDVDDDIIEFTPVYATPAKQAPTTAQQVAVAAAAAAAAQLPPPTPPTASPNKPSINQATVAQLLASRTNTESPSIAPVLKLGSPFTLTPSIDMDFYAQKKTMQPENMAAISYSLETPTPPVEAMEIVYPNEKSLAAPECIKTSAAALAQTVSAPAVIQQQAAHEAHIFATPYAHQQQPPQPQQPPQQQQPPHQQQPVQQQQQPQQQLPPRPKQRSESNSRQTQTLAAPTSAARNKSSVDLNNSNSDAVFHQRVKELYTELDEIMSDKVRAVKPELKSYGDEKQRIEADIKTLDNLISQKEEEHNRLLHLRCIKEELLARIERKERILIMKEILPSILNKNCSTSELYEMHSLLHNEQNAPMPSRRGSSAVEQLINRVENGLDDIKVLRGALGLQEKAPSSAELFMPPPPPQHYETQQLHRRNSVPAMRASLPPIVGDRSSIYGRSTAVHEDYRREQPEELLGKRNKQQPPQSRYQQLINESKQLTGSTTDLAGSSSYRQQQLQQPQDTRRSQTTPLDNHFDNEMPPKPLYNSSPLATGNQRKSNDTNKQYNEVHSMYRAELLQGLESLDRGANQNNRNSNNNVSKRMGATMNGPEELERRCQHCERYKATYMCAGCQNQWYCSRECQVRAWDTHWESCPN
ncbi:uncharacterized protein RAF2 [Drosophila montana]|uniref:uncharacterized protein RAF2 n=1 Tax=Drosophila montana TaxID=40370 RepID=UPI00313E3F80